MNKCKETSRLHAELHNTKYIDTLQHNTPLLVILVEVVQRAWELQVSGATAQDTILLQGNGSQLGC